MLMKTYTSLAELGNKLTLTRTKYHTESDKETQQ